MWPGVSFLRKLCNDALTNFCLFRTSHYGELAPECASTYFKYGCALLYKAQEETDPLGNVPKNAPNEESAKSTTTKDDSVNSKASVSNAEDATSSEKVDVEEGILLPHIVMSLKHNIVLCMLIIYNKALSISSSLHWFAPSNILWNNS